MIIATSMIDASMVVTTMFVIVIDVLFVIDDARCTHGR
jgi:hypothetical protein